jgi:hypothetical protein
LEDTGIDGRIILKRIVERLDGRAWTGLIWLRIRIGGSVCECSDVPSGSIKCGEFLE